RRRRSDSLESYSARSAMTCTRRSAASEAPSPDATMLTSPPPATPSESTSRMLFAFALRPFARSSIGAANAVASRTRTPAGRAWSATSGGSVASRSTGDSELGDMPRGHRRLYDLVAPRADGRRYAGGDRPLHERRVGDADELAIRRGELVEGLANGEHRAPDVHQHDDAAVAGSPGERRSDTLAVGPEGPVRAAAHGYDRDVRSGYLRHELRDANRHLVTVGDENEPYGAGRCGHAGYSTMSNAVRQ